MKADVEWVLFRNVGAYHEFALLQSMLDQLEIPILKKHRGSGQYTEVYMGSPFCGYDIYVPADRLKEANEMLENVQPVEPDLTLDHSSEAEDDQTGYILRYREMFKKLLLIFFVIPVVIGLIYGLFLNLKSIFD